MSKAQEKPADDPLDGVDGEQLVAELNLMQQYDEEIIAIRKLLYGLAGYGGDEPIPDGYSDIDAATDAMDRLDTLLQLADDLERVDEAIQKAETALAVADTQASDGGEMTKVRAAEITTRNELVKQALLGDRPTTEAVTVSRVQTLGEPAHDFKYQTVKDAWQSLAASWACFHRHENEQGTKVCRVNPDDLTEELVRVVEHDLGRDGLTKRLISGNSKGGR